MILEQFKALEVQTVGDVEQGVQAGISNESLPFVFEMLSKQLYSDPIGSMVREITSNCFDSHIEANKEDEPVIINKGYDKEEGYYIEFIDKGVGMSTDRVQKIYMNYFSSTKRDSNKQIGGFGIGSKSVLAYADMFYITTIYNNGKYEYIFHKGEERPTLESLLGYRTELINASHFNENNEWIEDFYEERIPVGTYTEECNGTTIKVIIEQNDLDKFTEALKNQLTYFDNTYFKNWNISNDYDIYEGKYFKYRSDIIPTYYGAKQPVIHICVGKVRYPIDFSKVEINSKINWQSFPVAVKFDIGELSITPNRENLRYDEKTKNLIKERIKLAIDELMFLFEKQNPEINTLEEYDLVSKEKPKITFNKEKDHHILIKDSTITKGFIFKPFKDLKIKTPKDNFFLSWECIGQIDGSGKRTMYTEYYDKRINNEKILNGRYLIVNKEDRFSSYTDFKIAQELGYHYLLKKKEIEYNDLSLYLGLKDSQSLGKAKTLSSYLSITNKIITDKFQKYSDLKASDEWILEYKKSLKEKSLAWIRRQNKEIVIKNVGSGSFETIKAVELQKRTGILVWGFKEEIKDLEKALAVGRCNPNFVQHKVKSKTGKTYYTDPNKAFRVIQIAKNIILDVQGAEKTIHVSGFFKTKIYKKILTAKYIQYKLNDLNLTNISFRMSLLPNFKKDYNNIEKLIAKYYDNSNGFRINLEEDTTKLDSGMLKEFEIFKAKGYDRHIPLLDAVSNLYDENLKEYTKYLIYKKIRIKNQFYLKPTENVNN